MKLSVSITTYNEEKNIEKVLLNIKDFADEIIIIDGQSKDKTVEIAKKYTKKIYVVPNTLNLNINKQKGLDKCIGDWILYLDADETLTENLKKEIKKTINVGTNFNGFFIPRKAFVFNKWIRFGGHYPDYQLRLFKNGTGKFKVSSVHDFLEVKGKMGYLKNAIDHIGYYKSLHHYITKMNNYTTNDAEQMTKRNIKKRKIFLFFKPLMVFCYLYLFRLGFLDGRYGFVFAVLSSYYEFILYSKYIEMKKQGTDIDK